MIKNRWRYLIVGQLVVSLVLLATVTWLSSRESARSDDRNAWVLHSQDVQISLLRTLSLLQDVETGARGFVLTGDSTFLEPLLNARQRIDGQLRSLASLVIDNRAQTAAREALALLVEQRIVLAQRDVDLRRTAGFEPARALIAEGSGKALMDQIRAQIERMRGTEQLLLAARITAARNEARITRDFDISGAVLGIALMAGAFGLLLRENGLRRQAELELQEAMTHSRLEEERHQAVAKIGTWTFDIAENEYICSAEMQRIFGVDLGAVLKPQDLMARVHREDIGNVVRAWTAAIETGQTYDVTYRIWVDGIEKWIHGRAEIRHDPAGHPLRLIGMSQDITEREWARHVVVASEHFINATLSALTDPVAVLDGHGRILKSNRVWQEFGGGGALRIDDIAEGTDYLSHCDRLASQGSADAEIIATKIRTLATGVPGGRFEHVLQLTEPEGWFLCRGTCFDYEGAVRIVVSYTDISARRRAEDALRELNANLEKTIAARTSELESANSRLVSKEQEIRSVVDNLSACVISIDERGIIQSANPAVHSILGYSVEAVTGKNVAMLMPAPERDDHDGFIRNYLHTGEARIIGIGREVIGLHHNGSRIPLDVSVSEYFVGGKRFFTGILRDNRERKAILRDLEEARDHAVQASNAKSEFLAAVSHEIRTPMNGVIGMLDVLRLSSLNNDQHEMVDVIRESAYSLLHVINDILDYSKIEAGRLDIEQTSLQVEEVVEGVCAMLDRVATTAGVELTMFVDPRLPTVVLGDPGRLRQVLVNLIGNAIKFSAGQTKRGRVSVRAQLIEKHDDQGFLDFEVTDNGIGMNAATVDKLFSPFTQADISTTREFGGTGLGLAISRNLVGLMGGTISVQSQPGTGSTFNARLPLVAASGSPQAVENISLLSDLRCLVVGGPASLGDHLAAYLAHAGTSVRRRLSIEADTHLSIADAASQLVVIHDAGENPGTVATCIESIRTRYEEYGRVLIVLILRGQRRTPRRIADGVVTLDGNVLRRRTFFAAVAMVAGRLTEPAPAPRLRLDQRIVPISREELRRQGRLILVAEDNEINQKVILAQLDVLGFVADVAIDGRDALRRWSSGQYGLLFTDLHMPEMDGYQLTRAIRASEPAGVHAPIVALTANAIKGEAERCREVGMDDYLTKPVPLESLRALLARWLPQADSAPEPFDPVAAPIERQASPSVPVDLAVLMELMGDNEPAALEILRDFASRSAPTVNALRLACASGESAAAAAAAHNLKSSTRAIGAIELSDVCAQIELIGRSGDSLALADKLPAFDEAMAAVAAFLQSV